MGNFCSVHFMSRMASTFEVSIGFHNTLWKNPSFLANPIKDIRVLFSPQSGQQENRRYFYIYIHFYIYLCRYVCVDIYIYKYTIDTQYIL